MPLAVDVLPAAGECHLWSVPVRTRPEWEALLAPDEAARAAAMPRGGRRDLLVTSRAAQRLVAHRYTGRPAGICVSSAPATAAAPTAAPDRPRRVRLLGHPHPPPGSPRRRGPGPRGHRPRHRPVPRCPAASPHPRGDTRRTRGPVPAARGEVPEAFTRLWSRKEAVVKLTGHGLAARLNRIEVRGELARPEGSPAEDWPAFPIHLRDAWVEGGRIAAIASTHRITALEPRSLSAPAATRNT
ncbi:4'-phosphopantetheinyl transferase superfamily protein [Streptomyces nogalater]